MVKALRIVLNVVILKIQNSVVAKTAKNLKEKFGSLEIYTSRSNEVIRKICVDAKIESYKTCEVCGTKKDVGMTKEWFKTICKDCYEVSYLKKIGKKWDPESIYKNFVKEKLFNVKIKNFQKEH